MLAGAGAGPGGPPPGAAPGGPPPGAPPSPEAAALGQGVSQLDGANPQGVADSLRSMSSDLAKVYLAVAMRMPAAAPHIARARESLDKAIKEANTAQQTLSAVRPIANSAGVGPGMMPQGGAPDISALLG